MCWYKLKLKGRAALIFGAALLVCCAACKPEITNNGAFDLKGFMTKDIARLKKMNKPVVKTVFHNNVPETKKVHIADWDQELSLFIDAGINKPAWKNSYTIIDEDSLLIYRAKDPDLKVRELLINRNKRKVKWILIYTKTKNFLYQTTRRLTYFPDSLYVIEMEQKVRLMRKNVYKAEGKIKY